MFDTYGGVVRIRAVPGFYVYLLSDPLAIEHVLQKNHRNYRKPDLFNKPASLLVGNGILTSEGEFWLRQRRLAQPAFHRQHLTALSTQMCIAAGRHAQEWESRADGSPVDVVAEMMRITLAIAGATLFSADITDEAGPIGRAFRSAFDYVRYRMDRPYALPVWWPTARHRRFRRAKHRLDRLVLELIDARRRSSDRPRDLLSLLLAAQDEATGQGMSDDQLKDEALTLLTAGHETVGSALSWTWYLLASHPEAQSRLHAELDAQLGGRAPTMDDLPNLPYTRAVFEEAMRLYPPAWGMPREAIAEDEILGYRIEAKVNIVVSQFCAHRHPEYWKRPDEFYPDHFLNEQSAARPKFAYFPFGGGPRICVGQSFAMIEGPLVLATLAQRCAVELVPDQNIEMDATFTLRPKGPVMMTIRSR